MNFRVWAGFADLIQGNPALFVSTINIYALQSGMKHTCPSGLESVFSLALMGKIMYILCINYYFSGKLTLNFAKSVI
ncbi:hypothetical protein NIES2100_39660 [Calothrix sp. NIES-2100]|nr:hypothetical protein NIES2100_39660 [Calothrix sp. NIES-2100]